MIIHSLLFAVIHLGNWKDVVVIGFGLAIVARKLARNKLTEIDEMVKESKFGKQAFNTSTLILAFLMLLLAMQDNVISL